VGVEPKFLISSLTSPFSSIKSSKRLFDILQQILPFHYCHASQMKRTVRRILVHYTVVRYTVLITRDGLIELRSSFICRTYIFQPFISY
jgi:hypothetical protein